MPGPSSSTTVPGPDGPATDSAMLCSSSKAPPARQPRAGGAALRRSGWVVEAAVRNPEVGELAERRGADAGRGQPVGELGRGRVGGEILVDQRVGHPGDGPKFDRDDVVGDPAAV